MKKVFSLLAATAIVGALLVPALPATAAPFAGAATCSVTLSTWPTPAGGNADCSGTAAGAFLPTGPVCTPTCGFRAHVDAYAEPCVAGEPPLTGTAEGDLYVNPGSGEVHVSAYAWVRVGVVAVLVLDGGAGVAAFAPLPPLPTCAASGSLNAQVVGLAVNPL